MSNASAPKLSVVHNPFFDAKKSAQQTALLQNAAAALGASVSFVRSDDVDASIASSRPRNLARKVLFLEKNVALARALVLSGHVLYNGADAIEACDNKAYTHVKMLGANVAQPPTLVGPMTFGLGAVSPVSGFVRQVGLELGYPAVVKEVYGSFGRQVYLVKDQDELMALLARVNGRQVIAQRYLGVKRGQSVRAVVVNGRVVGALLQTNPNDFRSNLTQGSVGEAYKLTEAAQDMVLRAAKALRLFYGGIDLLFGDAGEPVFCEANSNAQLSAASAALRTDLGQTLLRAVLEDETYGG